MERTKPLSALAPEHVNSTVTVTQRTINIKGEVWALVGFIVLWFIIFTVLFWLIFYSLKPSFVLQTGSNQVDTAKVLLAAVISAVILIIAIWLIRTFASRKY